jgi:hypothetical protein
MAGTLKQTPGVAMPAPPAPMSHPLLHKILVTVTIGLLTLFILIPVVNIFAQALSKGVGSYFAVFHAAEPPAGKGLTPMERRKICFRACSGRENLEFGQAFRWDRGHRCAPQSHLELAAAWSLTNSGSRAAPF